MVSSTRPSSIAARRLSRLPGVADLDVTPVMNMFIILIPFLISMSAFVHLATHDFSLPGESGADQAITRSELPLTVVIGPEAMALVQGDLVLGEFPLIDGQQDLPGLLSLLKKQDFERVIVAVDDAESIGGLVACLDAIRGAGCAEVGLAAGVGLNLGGRVDQ